MTIAVPCTGDHTSTQYPALITENPSKFTTPKLRLTLGYKSLTAFGGHNSKLTTSAFSAWNPTQDLKTFNSHN